MKLGRSKKKITYHGRTGRPVVHQTATGRKYIMVRAEDGGTKRLYEGSLYYTKTAAGHFLKGYRGGRFGAPKVKPGTVKVGKVGKYWGVFDSNPKPRGKVISLEQGKRLGKKWYG